MFGCTVFALAAAACTVAPSIEILLFCRLLQGLGSGAATVLSTALVFGDMFAGTAIGIMAGAFVNGKLSARKVSPKVSLYVGLSLASAAVCINVLLTFLGLDQPLTLFPCLFAFTFSAGLLAPTTAHGCVGLRFCLGAHISVCRQTGRKAGAGFTARELA
ncbi:MAG: hypothetical protein KGS72_25765 [Cyanobacteria bacterium REEB67]|nr:hypothetical protein [Cyanobacteria bacterium REEB67]